MKIRRKTHLIVSITFALGSVAYGAEKTVPRDQVPSAVLKTVNAQSKNASVKRFVKDYEAGKLEYEAEMEINGHSRDITIAPDGSLLEVEEQVDFKQLPASVQSGLKARAGKGTITKIESITKKGTLVAYEAAVRTDGRRSEIQVGPNGERLSHPE